MKRLEAILAAALSVSLTGCKLLAKKPVTPPAPPPPVAAAKPLSVPQTQVQLPSAQPVEPGALATKTSATTETLPVAPPAAPAGKPGGRPAGRASSSRNASPPKPEPPPKPTEAAAEAPRPQVQEILPADVQQKLQKSALDAATQARQLVAQARKRSRLSPQDQEVITRIEQFLKLSDNSAKAGDMRDADDLAVRALILAKDLQSGK